MKEEINKVKSELDGMLVHEEMEGETKVVSMDIIEFLMPRINGPKDAGITCIALADTLISCLGAMIGVATTSEQEQLARGFVTEVHLMYLQKMSTLGLATTIVEERMNED